MKKILSIFGTRPEAIKMAPVINALAADPASFVSRVCVSAQHRQMLDQVLDLFRIAPDHDLDIMTPGQDLFDVTCGVLKGLKPVLERECPDLVLVHGDTTTTMAAGLAAFYSGIPVGHVEAGLRTHNKRAPFPEEMNRRVAGVVTDLHFAPTHTARANLLSEGIASESVFVTGNTVIDALLMTLAKIRDEHLEGLIVGDLTDAFPGLGAVLGDCRRPDPDRRLILVTGHRRENFGRGFERICRALKTIAAARPEVNVIYPVHLNPQVQEPVRRVLSDCANIHLIDPLDYLPFVYLMHRAHIIVTDSGGVQEEAPALGRPVLVMRETTERPEAVAAGTVKLVGTDTDAIVDGVMTLMDDPRAYDAMARALNPYGDGRASARIVAALRHWQPPLPI